MSSETVISMKIMMSIIMSMYGNFIGVSSVKIVARVRRSSVAVSSMKVSSANAGCKSYNGYNLEQNFLISPATELFILFRDNLVFTTHILSPKCNYNVVCDCIHVNIYFKTHLGVHVVDRKRAQDDTDSTCPIIDYIY